MNSYFLWKTAHILSAGILFGTGIGIAFFCWVGSRRALRDANIDLLRGVLRFTVLADFVFTAPAVVFQFASGLMLMHLMSWPWHSAWAAVVMALYLLVGLCWLPVVAIQIRLRDWAEAASTVSSLPPSFHRAFRWWFVLGVPAFTTVVTIFYLMVAKPLAVV